MISCIFTAVFYAIDRFVNAITNITTIITNLQTNFCFMQRAIYHVSFSNFSNVTHGIQKFGKQCKIKWTKENKLREEKSRKESE